jgi:hypothetical protein
VRIPARLLLATALAALPAFAIVTRPDRDDAEYLELASRYSSAVTLGDYGEGALIAPRWVLTAASVARALGEARGATHVRVGERDSEVQSVFVAPEGEIALVLLREPVAGIEPTPIHRESDEQGKGVVIVGHGATGRIGAEPIHRDGRKRGAINTVDRVDPRTLALEIKKPDDASDLQGAAGPGDEGAPAFVEVKGRLSVAGIALGPRGAALPKAGDADVYARVSAFAAWIDDTMFKAAAEEAAASTQKPSVRR